ncbi:MAG: TetR/AcrR family transcriptional regulator [Eubacteriales bacterium]|nr:TetR/AcrR family transcriptional regulator [Eubacteriales bacterium]
MECMADALLQLMRQKDFGKITINEIAALAGVNRATWFRNFESKQEALTFKIIQLWYHYADAHGIQIRNRYSIHNAIDFFTFNYDNRQLLRLIYDAQLPTVVYDAFWQIMKPQYGANAQECYQSRFYSFGLFGLLDEWIKRDFHESPAEMTDLFQMMMRS